MRDKGMRELKRRLHVSGFIVAKTNGGHLRITHVLMAGPYFAAATPSDHRAMKNIVAELRRRTSRRVAL